MTFTTNNSAIKTDDNQWVIKVNSNEYWVIQIRLWGDEDDYAVTINYIDIETYPLEDIETTLSFYYAEDEIETVIKNNKLVAEILAEEIDDFQAEFKGTFEECEVWVETKLKEMEVG